jgi:hypothetical protein
MTKYDAYVYGILEALKNDKAGKEKDEEKEGFDAKKADLNKDGKVSEYEEKRGKAIQKAIAEKGKK